MGDGVGGGGGRDRGEKEGGVDFACCCCRSKGVGGVLEQSLGGGVLFCSGPFSLYVDGWVLSWATRWFQCKLSSANKVHSTRLSSFAAVGMIGLMF